MRSSDVTLLGERGAPHNQECPVVASPQQLRSPSDLFATPSGQEQDRRRDTNPIAQDRAGKEAVSTGHSGLVQCGQRRARIEIFMAQWGHSFSVGAAGAGWRRALLMPLTTKKSAQATRRKLISVLMKMP